MSENRHGSRPIDSLRGKSFVRSSATPQATRNIEITTKANPAAKFIIEKPTKINLSFAKQPGATTPKIERPAAPLKVTPAPKPANYNPAPQSTPMAAPIPAQTPTQTTIQIPQRPSTPNQVSPMMHQISNPAPIVPSQPPPVIITKEFISPQPPAAADYFSKFSLLSFVTSFKDEKSFNETDLYSLGLNLNKEEPLLPMLHSVLSDAPLLNNSCYPMPKSYAALERSENPIEKINLFSDSILLFIFYTQSQTDMQTAASNELIRRGFQYDEEKCTWSNSEGAEWDINQWKFAEQETDE
ncbi:hypothetical protein TVAG_046710 [Trichomonas vaginalis G3]|uniref:NOT2/NOT3/NOT5 C-terminal domain-containing protein n=1 Tax=Trichomonas vaginalis (strain ATCC PRA-98 / G3) TaxID=412133 RepID=A2EAP6_TRIV3|nr:CCR4 NOT-related family [Trichomonas vaginalis G3]EAY10249.1 hypothetical protein TVAG_046710 [Trichomonas vaginalis G3]KAI5487731.1 CCR4 NOT-related family [Trichomonas vaginalis G3]|eukprot:XP_001322472.1 hypothetical protein [Trichomonas vaginalis G3]